MEPETSDDSEFSTTAEFDGIQRRIILNSKRGLAATVHVPADNKAIENLRAVVLVPGWSGPRTGPADILVGLANHLAQNGFSAIRLDMPARGDADGSVSQCGLDEMIEMTCAAVELSSVSGPVDVIGICSGGNVALGAATAKIPLGRVVSISTFPFQRSRSKEMDKRRRWKNLKNYATKAFSPSTWMRLLRGEINVGRVKKNLNAADANVAGARNLKDSARDIEAELSQWKGKALFVWGGGDEEAPPSRTHFEKLHSDGMGERCEFVTVAGANHNFYGQAWREELFSRVVEFLKN